MKCLQMNRRKRANGFTLMELLIVISIIVILMLLAVPNYLKFKIHANETSAMNSVKAIYSAQMLYTGQYPSIGYACSLAALGGSTQATNTAAQSGMLSGDLSSGTKDGYNFAISCPQKSNDSAANAQYKVTAVPATPNRTGIRGFCMNEDGQLMDDPTGGSNCSELAR
jgi:type IV pilus assembly protein PilA